DMVWGGLSFRPGDALAPMLGYQTSWVKKDGYNTINNCIRVGYSYDLTMSEIKNYSSGSHEVFVTYCFSVLSNPPQNRYSNPRFL
ncbi:type IX secretion system membrane protein PorP/SprF, partial [uncultured Gimesia sp.]|uniref:type IX secretion system membrane protein PorP/SprF n=1 Tax=uncultured Gimesia sp. TaxID=1678688 RepID=UPI00262FA27A